MLPDHRRLFPRSHYPACHLEPVICPFCRSYLEGSVHTPSCMLPQPGVMRPLGVVLLMSEEKKAENVSFTAQPRFWLVLAAPLPR